MISLSIGLNAVSSHGTCTAVFVAVAAILAFCVASIRTLSRISALAWVGLASILTSGEFLLSNSRSHLFRPGHFSNS